MRSLFWIQTVLIMAGTSVSYYYMGDFGVLSASYGGGIALFSSLILSRRATQAMKSAVNGSQHTMALLYIGVVQRYVFVLLGLGVGLVLLNLNAKPMLAVFGVAQLAYFMSWLGNE